jgi:hypothetical protein
VVRGLCQCYGRTLIGLNFTAIYFDKKITDSVSYLLRTYSCQYLERLTFNKIIFEDIENINTILKDSQHLKLRALSIKNIPLNENIGNLANYISTIKTLNEINLENNNLENFECIAYAIAENQDLVSLKISQNNFEVADYQAFLQALKKLKDLRYQNCGLCDEQTLEIKRAILVFPEIPKLMVKVSRPWLEIKLPEAEDEPSCDDYKYQVFNKVELFVDQKNPSLFNQDLTREDIKEYFEATDYDPYKLLELIHQMSKCFDDFYNTKVTDQTGKGVFSV